MGQAPRDAKKATVSFGLERNPPKSRDQLGFLVSIDCAYKLLNLN